MSLTKLATYSFFSHLNKICVFPKHVIASLAFYLFQNVCNMVPILGSILVGKSMW